MKRLIAAILLAFFVIMPVLGYSESARTEFCGGGVTERIYGNYRTRALIGELNVAYLSCDSAYLTKGKQAVWTIVASGGDGVYSYEFSIFHRFGTDGWFTYEGSQARSSANVFYHTPEQSEGQYLLEVRVYDSAGAFIKWQSLVYETASGEGSAAYKAREVVNECLEKAGNSDFERAMWLHDWLVKNADYDYNYEYYYADGVLLHGKGVCQSYAYAYEMMLKMIGIDCVYITGKAGGETHGWNLVFLNGDWYHVDVTWDDPGPGRENRRYFCVTDEIMRKDHIWDSDSGVMPVCDAKEYLYAGLTAVTGVENAQELIGALESLMLKRLGYAEFFYEGSDETFDLQTAVDDYLMANGASKGVEEFEMSADDVFLTLRLDYGSGYADLSQAQTVVFEKDAVTVKKGETAHVNVYTLPLTASREKLAFRSDNEACAYYEDGKIIALSPGEAVITAYLPNGDASSITVRVTADGKISILYGVTSVESEAFMNCVSAQTVVIPESVTSIGDNAFAGCEMLYEIVIPDSVTSISPSAFDGCDRLTIYASEGSYAHGYALEHEISFEIITESTLNSD